MVWLKTSHARDSLVTAPRLNSRGDTWGDAGSGFYGFKCLVVAQNGVIGGAGGEEAVHESVAGSAASGEGFRIGRGRGVEKRIGEKGV